MQRILQKQKWKKGCTASVQPFYFGGPPVSRTRHQRIMLTTTVFTACFQFVVWTVSCLYDLPVQSLHVPNIAVWLRSGLPRCKQQRLPRIWVVLHASRVNLPTCNPTATDRRLRFRPVTFKSAALTKHELEARQTDCSYAVLYLHLRSKTAVTLEAP